MTFEEYLTKRRVNVAAFAAGEPQRFAEWQQWFGQMHPESFYVMVKMVLNDVRRNYWLAEVAKPAAAPSEPARPAGRRAAIARPAGRRAAIARPAATTLPEPIATPPVPEIPEINPSEFAPSTTPQETPAAKPARPVFKPRGVIKKPAETPETETTAELKAEETKPEETPTAEAKPLEGTAEAKPSAETSETAPAKPARPRPVIKRPAALSTSAETPGKTPDEIAGKPAPEDLKTVGESTEKVSSENTEAPKPSRPRPVFKRPAAAATSETTSSEIEKTVAETDSKPVATVPPEVSADNPVARPGQEGASETKAVAEEIHNNPDAAEAAEEVSAAVGHVPLTPRPRPVFNRPAPKPPETTEENAAKTVGKTAQKPEAPSEEIQPKKQKETDKNSGEDQAREVSEKPQTPEPLEPKAEAPKPPRPRPVFKRPPKPENDTP